MPADMNKLMTDLAGRAPIGAVNAFVEMGAEAVGPLLEVVGDPNAAGCARTFGAIALGQLKDPRMLQPFLTLLADPDLHWETKRRVAWALGELGDATAVDALIEACRDAHEDVRGFPAAALGRIGDPRALDALSVVLVDPETMDDYTPVSYFAATAIGQIGGPEAASILCEVIESWTPYTAPDHMSSIMAAITGKAEKVIRSDDMLCSLAAQGLANCGDSSLVPKLRQLHDTVGSDTVKKALQETIQSLEQGPG